MTTGRISSYLQGLAWGLLLILVWMLCDHGPGKVPDDPLADFPLADFAGFPAAWSARCCVACAGKAPPSAGALSLMTSLVVFGGDGLAFVRYQQGGSGWLLYEDFAWIPHFGIRYTLGLDGMSLLMVLLTGFLQVVAVLISWPVKRHGPMFFALLLVMESGMMGVFLALDLSFSTSSGR